MTTEPAVHLMALPAAVLLAAAIWTATAADATPLHFHDHVMYPAGQMPADVAAGDLNGDTYPDLAIANVLTADVSVLINRGDGTFGAQVRYPAGGQARSLAIGDLDGDSHPDLAVGLQSGPHDLAVFVNDGNGAFTGPIHYGVGGGEAITTVIAALNESDRPDVAMSRIISHQGDVAVFRNRGDGSLFAPDLYEIDPSAFIAGLTTAHLDADADIDLVATFVYSGESPVRLINRGRGTFDVIPPFNSETTVTPAIGAGDFNEDGLDDLATISVAGIELFLNDGNGSFSDPLVYDPEILVSSASRMTVGDLDRSGTLDVVLAGGGQNQVSTVLGDGHGLLGEESLHATGSFPGDCAVADLNGDDWPDLAVSNRDGSSVSVLMSAPESASIPAEPGSPGIAWLGPLRPNPARTGVSARYQVAEGIRGQVTVYDAAGRTVHLGSDGSGGNQVWSWDLRAQGGHLVPPGVYFIQLEAQGFRLSRTLTVVR